MMLKGACDSCRKKKIHCDRASPRCDWCSHHDLPCTFSRIVRRSRNRPPHMSGKDLAARIERIEHALENASKSFGLSSSMGNALSDLSLTSSSDPGAASVLGLDSTRADDFNRFHCTGYFMGDIGFLDGLPIFSEAGCAWIRTRTGEQPILEHIHTFGPPWQAQKLGGPVQPLAIPQLELLKNVEALIPRFELDRLSKSYIASHYHVSLPFIDPALFEDTIQAAYVTEDTGSQSIDARACIFSFVALVSLWKLEGDSSLLIDKDLFASIAGGCLVRTSPNISLEAIQSAFLLGLYHSLSGNPYQGNVYNSLAARMVMEIGGHLQPHIVSVPCRGPDTDGKQNRAGKHARRLFWMVYKFDKHLALRTGQPPSIDDAYCDLTHFDLTLPGTGGSVEYEFAPSKAANAGAGDPRLSVLTSKTLNQLYSFSARQVGNSELLMRIRELDSEVEEWRQSITPSWRPSLRSTGRQMPSAGVVEDLEMPQRLYQSLNFQLVHCEYYYLVSMIHRASGRCYNWEQNEREALQGISSSIAISAEASRSTLIHLSANLGSVIPETFWITVFFPISAVLSLFSSILLDPLDSQSQGDIQLIGLTPTLIRKMVPSLANVQKREYLESVDNFINELVRLCKLCVARAEDTRSYEDETRNA